MSNTFRAHGPTILTLTVDEVFPTFRTALQSKLGMSARHTTTQGAAPGLLYGLDTKQSGGLNMSILTYRYRASG